MWTKEEASIAQFAVELRNVLGDLTLFHGQSKVAETEIEEFLIRPTHPRRFFRQTVPRTLPVGEWFTMHACARFASHAKLFQLEVGWACCNPATYSGGGVPCFGSPQ